jgi:hypothetical protein
MMLEGEIGEIHLIERLVELGRERFTGAVRFENDGIIKILYFKTGDVLSASTNDRADSVDEILLRAGKVTREHVKQALARRKESETLGDALLNLGFITRKELTWARRVQAIGVIRSINQWTSGSYTVVADYLPKREEGTLFPLQQIIVELMVTEQDRQPVDRALDGGEAVLVKAPDFDEAFHRLGLNDDAEQIAQAIDGERNAAEIASASGKDAFNVYKLLHALATLGLLEKRTRGGSDYSFATEGVADAADAWEAPVPEEPVPASDPSFEWGPEADAPDVVVAPQPEAEMPVEVPAQAAIAEPPRHVVHEEPPEDLDVAGQAWGFDEAQVETVRRAALPPPPRGPRKEPVAKEKASRGMAWILVAVALIALTFGGFAGWNWWQAHQAPPAAAPAPSAVVTRPPVHPASSRPAVSTAATATVVTPPATAATTTPQEFAPSPTTNVTATSVPVTTASTASAPPATGRMAAANSSPAPLPAKKSGTAPAAAAPQPVATAAGDATRARFDAMAREFAEQGNGVWAVQFELVCQTYSVKKALDTGGKNVWFVPISYRGQSCYRVFWGRFRSREEAQRSVGQVPSVLRSASAPVVVRVASP